jgi:hypothetical protein
MAAGDQSVKIFARKGKNGYPARDLNNYFQSLIVFELAANLHLVTSRAPDAGEMPCFWINLNPA